MKNINILLTAVVALLLLVACGNDDDFTETIFDDTVEVVDENATTYPFDLWIYNNFTVPYNVEILYEFDLSSSDLDFQLTPPEYKRSQMLAHFILYLFYNVYEKYGGDDFMKEYGPRIFHFIGSSGYSPTTGTEVLGTASGGVKITLYKINEMKEYTEGVVYDGNDVYTLNENYFHTMHHEFSHILHQTKSYPVTFGQVTSGTYDPMNWQDRDSTTTHRLGYVTHYASSAIYEDFVETLSCVITDTDYRWMTRIIDACLDGVSTGDKEQVKVLIDSLNIQDYDNPDAVWNNFTIYKESEYDSSEGDYVETGYYVMDCHRDLTSTTVNKEYTKYVSLYKYTDGQTFETFDDFLENFVEEKTDAEEGMSAILRKLDIATSWYTEYWGLNLYTIRQEVRERQEALGDYMSSDEFVIYDYQ